MSKAITVIVMTYNQKQYISKALDSILVQKGDIDFDIIIHDDCSSDGTLELIREYQKNNPNKITIIEEKERRFIEEGFNMMIYNHVVPFIDSKYVAYCDGDDYWCDDYKLQKQLAFMEAHPDYSMCFHCSYQLKNDVDLSSKWFVDDEGDIDMSFIISDVPGIKIATSSLFVRSDVFKDFPNWRKLYPVEDIPLYMNAAMNGKIHRLSDLMCVYRQFAVGSWSSQNKDNIQRTIDHLEKMKAAINCFNEQTGGVYQQLVSKQVLSFEFRIALLKKDYKTIFLKKYKHLYKRLSKKERVSLKLQYRLPHLYNLIHRKKK